jgi:hypothetical protein
MVNAASRHPTAVSISPGGSSRTGHAVAIGIVVAFTASAVAKADIRPADAARVQAELQRYPLANLYSYSRPAYVLIREAAMSALPTSDQTKWNTYCVRIVLIDPNSDSAPRRLVVHFIATVPVSREQRGRVSLRTDQGRFPRVCELGESSELTALVGRRSERR